MANEKNPDGLRDGMTPLQRYLAKQKGVDASKGDSEAAPAAQKSGGRPDEASAALNAPPFPPPGRQSPPPRPQSAVSPSLGTAAGVGRRALAYMIDSAIVWFIALPFWMFFSFMTWAVSTTLSSALIGPFSVSQFLAVQVVTYFYYGWFYREKGASPGKMMLGLQISGSETNSRIGFTRAYLRESFGKYLSTFIFGLGFLIALFRSDRKALHDMIFETQVTSR